jgi:nitrite reductase (NADH) small subunit
MLCVNSSSREAEMAWVPVAYITELSPGQGRCFLIGPHRVALFYLRSGEIHALEAVCPHRGGPLAEGLIGRATVVCPLHGYSFALADGRGLNSELRVRSFPVEVRHGRIHVRLFA